jgi:hypothetical protein
MAGHPPVGLTCVPIGFWSIVKEIASALAAVGSLVSALGLHTGHALQAPVCVHRVAPGSAIGRMRCWTTTNRFRHRSRISFPMGGYHYHDAWLDGWMMEDGSMKRSPSVP